MVSQIVDVADSVHSRARTSFMALAKMMNLDDAAISSILQQCNQLGYTPGEHIEVTFLMLTGRLDMFARKFPTYVAHMEACVRSSLDTELDELARAITVAANKIIDAGAEQADKIQVVAKAAVATITQATVAAHDEVGKSMARVTELPGAVGKAAEAGAAAAVKASLTPELERACDQIAPMLKKRIEVMVSQEVKARETDRHKLTVMIVLACMAVGAVVETVGFDRGYSLGVSDCRRRAVGCIPDFFAP